MSSGRLQNEDFKSEAEILAAGGSKSQLLNDTKIYISASGINKTLDDAIVDGDIGAGGGGAAGDVSVFPADGFKEAIFDRLDTAIAGADSAISSSNGVQNISKSLVKLLCDKSKTFTTTGTALTISGAPSFTIAAGDIVYSGTTWRKIASISSQTAATLDAAFPVDLSGAAGMISQAAFSKDFINLGSAAQKTRILDLYASENIDKIHVEYDDSLVTDDDVSDYVEVARIAVSASNEGLNSDTVTYPTSDKFSPIFKRPQAPTYIPDYNLQTNTNKQRLFLAFFPNPDNASVTTQANLLGFECSLIPDLGTDTGTNPEQTVAKTADFTIQDSEAIGNRVFTNYGATGKIKATFPTCASGKKFTLIVAEAQIYEMQTVNNDVIYGNGVSGLPYVASNTQGAIFVFYGTDDNRWMCNSASTLSDAAARAVYAGGLISGSTTTNIEYLQIGTLANSQNFGNLSLTRRSMASMASTTRAVFGSGTPQASQMDFITFATLGTATSFGNATQSFNESSGVSNGTRGVHGGGYNAGYVAALDYISIATTGNGINFGNLTQARNAVSSMANTTKGLWMTGHNGSIFTQIIDYVMIATIANAVSWGNITSSGRNTYNSGCSNSTRGVVAGGYSGSGTQYNNIDYVELATTGNSVNFGNLAAVSYGLGAAASSARAVWLGGTNTSDTGSVNTIQYVEIATTGNASNFGTAQSQRHYSSGASSGHGGL